MGKLTRKVGIRAVSETTAGTDPGSGYTGILVNEGVTLKPNAKKIERNYISSTFGPKGHVIGQKSYTFTCETELKGGGVSGSDIQAPELDVLLKCCGFRRSDALVLPVTSISGTFEIGEEINDTTSSESIGHLADIVQSGTSATLYIRDSSHEPSSGDSLEGASSSATATAGSYTDALCYRPATEESDIDTATIHVYRDGIKHVLTYCLGTVDFDFRVGEYPVAKFQIQGIYTDPTDEANPTLTYSDLTPPLCLNAGLQIADVDMSLTCATALSLGLGCKVSPLSCINSSDGIKGFMITGRDSKGSIDPEVTSLSDFNPWAAWKSSSGQKIYCAIGSSAGNRIRPLVPRALYDEMAYGDRDGTLIYNLPFICQEGDEGDDELWLFFY